MIDRSAIVDAILSGLVQHDVEASVRRDVLARRIAERVEAHILTFSDLVAMDIAPIRLVVDGLREALAACRERAERLQVERDRWKSLAEAPCDACGAVAGVPVGDDAADAQGRSTGLEEAS